jgi:hypothetical protein
MVFAHRVVGECSNQFICHIAMHIEKTAPKFSVTESKFEQPSRASPRAAVAGGVAQAICDSARKFSLAQNMRARGRFMHLVRRANNLSTFSVTSGVVGLGLAATSAWTAKHQTPFNAEQVLQYLCYGCALPNLYVMSRLYLKDASQQTLDGMGIPFVTSAATFGAMGVSGTLKFLGADLATSVPAAWVTAAASAVAAILGAKVYDTLVDLLKHLETSSKRGCVFETAEALQHALVSLEFEASDISQKARTGGLATHAGASNDPVVPHRTEMECLLYLGLKAFRINKRLLATQRGEPDKLQIFTPQEERAFLAEWPPFKKFLANRYGTILSKNTEALVKAHQKTNSKKPKDILPKHTVVQLDELCSLDAAESAGNSHHLSAREAIEKRALSIVTRDLVAGMFHVLEHRAS